MQLSLYLLQIFNLFSSVFLLALRSSEVANSEMPFSATYLAC